MLKVEELHPYDTYAPLFADVDKLYTYEEAQAMILEAFLPMGDKVQLIVNRAFAERWIDKLSIRCTSPNQPAASLSGGNQQKLALARLLYHDVDVLLLDEPTRGIDVASRAEVYRVVRRLAEQGKAVLVVSSYIPELLELCHQVAVMRRGQLGEARAAAELDEHQLLMEATGA